jgi:hypothetical protein
MNETPSPLEAFDTLRSDLVSQHSDAKGRLQTLYGTLGNEDVQTYEQKRAVVTRIQRVMQEISHKAKCTRCGLPAILNASLLQFRMYDGGVFHFDHNENGTLVSHDPSITLPELIPIPDPEIYD